MKPLPNQHVMEAIDTNILVRLATRDDEQQFAKADQLVRSHFSPRSPAWISIIVLTEFVWVLNRLYSYTRPEIAFSVSQLLRADSFQLEDHQLVISAMAQFSDSKADLADCLILARNQSRSITPTHTFDRRAAKLDGFQLL